MLYYLKKGKFVWIENFGISGKQQTIYCIFNSSFSPFLEFFLAPHIPLSFSPLFPLSTPFPSSCPLQQEACPPPHKQSRSVGRNRTSSSMTHLKVHRSRTPQAFTRHPHSFQGAYPRVGSPWQVCLSPCPRVRPCWWTSRLQWLEVSSR